MRARSNQGAIWEHTLITQTQADMESNKMCKDKPAFSSHETWPGRRGLIMAIFSVSNQFCMGIYKNPRILFIDDTHNRIWDLS